MDWIDTVRTLKYIVQVEIKNLQAEICLKRAAYTY